jgi:hypothetical protein
MRCGLMRGSHAPHLASSASTRPKFHELLALRATYRVIAPDPRENATVSRSTSVST